MFNRCKSALVLLIFLNRAAGQASDGLCSIAWEYCGFQQRGTGTAPKIPVVRGRVGKAGPPGPPGPAAAVNYTRINEEIETKCADVTRGMDGKLRAMKRRLETAESKMGGYVRPSGCDNVHKLDAKQWNETGGLFDIYPSQVEEAPMEVYCDITTDGGRWTVIQRRVDGSEDFYRGWNDYQSGFGEKDKEFWLGLEAIHQMTKGGNYELRVDMMDWEGNTAYAKYSTFTVGDNASKYRMIATGYSGNAGDSLAHHTGHKFTTIDSDNDADGGNCAVKYKGAWWHNVCHHSNLNGLYVEGGRRSDVTYGQGINWYHWKGHEYALKFTEMKLRKKQ